METEQTPKEMNSEQARQQIDLLKEMLEQQKLESTQSKNMELNLQQRQQHLAEQKLLNDADIKQSLTAKPEVDYDSLTPKEIIDVVANAFETAIEARTQLATSQINEPITSMSKRLDDMQKYLLRKEAVSGVESARQRFDDFDEFKDDITKVLDKYPGIAIDDAYLLAKGHSAIGTPSQKSIETEKPMNLATRAAAAEERYIASKKGEKVSAPSRNFKAFLASAVDRVLANRKE